MCAISADVNCPYCHHVQQDKYLVVFGVPKKKTVDQVRLYREIKLVAREGGFDKVCIGAYIVNSDYACERANTLAELAARFGKGAVGEKGGPQVYRIIEQSPADYFANRELARRIADELLADHRKRDAKRKSRSIPALVARFRGESADDELTAALKRTTRSREKAHALKHKISGN
jgi:hypothetical protein